MNSGFSLFIFPSELNCPTLACHTSEPDPHCAIRPCGVCAEGVQQQQQQWVVSSNLIRHGCNKEGGNFLFFPQLSPKTLRQPGRRLYILYFLNLFNQEKPH